MSYICFACEKKISFLLNSYKIGNLCICSNCAHDFYEQLASFERYLEIIDDPIKDTVKTQIAFIDAVKSSDLTDENKTKLVREIKKVIGETYYNRKEVLIEFTRVQKEHQIIADRLKQKDNILVTTTDIHRPYEVIGPVYFQVSNKGIFNSQLDELIDKYRKKINELKENNLLSEGKFDWGFLYGEWSVGQNQFDSAFYVAVQELKERTARLGGDAIIGMRQDIDIDTNGFSFFYLQIYGTAVRYIDTN